MSVATRRRHGGDCIRQQLFLACESIGAEMSAHTKDIRCWSDDGAVYVPRRGSLCFLRYGTNLDGRVILLLVAFILQSLESWNYSSVPETEPAFWSHRWTHQRIANSVTRQSQWLLDQSNRFTSQWTTENTLPSNFCLFSSCLSFSDLQEKPKCVEPNSTVVAIVQWSLVCNSPLIHPRVTENPTQILRHLRNRYNQYLNRYAANTAQKVNLVDHDFDKSEDRNWFRTKQMEPLPSSWSDFSSPSCRKRFNLRHVLVIQT